MYIATGKTLFYFSWAAKGGGGEYSHRLLVFVACKLSKSLAVEAVCGDVCWMWYSNVLPSP